MSDSEDPVESVDDLFGDEDEGDASPAPRERDEVLDDDDLASDPEGVDVDRSRRYDYDDEPQETRERVVMGIQTYRHRVPNAKDDQLRVLRVPKFVRLEPTVYHAESFQPTEYDLANARAQHPQHVCRIRRDASTGDLKSNTNLYRWSDGSVTISIGGEQYEIQKKGLAPAPGKPYNELHDGHYYAAAAELSSNVLLTVGHISEQYNVRPNKTVGDDALSVLAEQMAAASRGVRTADMIIKTTKDPELQKKEAEAAEKERMKAQRRRENAAAKINSGLGRSGRGGLSIGDLEGRRGGGARKRGLPGSNKAKRRRPEYDSDDDLPHGVGRHEDYDMEDGFLVGSDEEEEEIEDDEDEEEILEDDDNEKPRSKRQRTVEVDEDAEGDDDDVGETSGRARRRNIIDDDDEE